MRPMTLLFAILTPLLLVMGGIFVHAAWKTDLTLRR